MESEPILLQTRRFRVVRREFTTPDGKRHSREVVQHPGAVAVVPIFDDGRICLIENVRVAVGQTLLEIPTGTREPDEEPLATARRELREETGYEAREFRPLLDFWMSPGILNERMHVYLARGLQPGARDLDEGEQIINRIVSWDEAVELLRSGQIQDAKTLAGLLYYDRFVRESAS